MQKPSSQPAVHILRVSVNYRLAWQIWWQLLLLLLLGRLIRYDWSILQAVAKSWPPLFFVTGVALAGLLIPLLTEPLFFRVDQLTGTLTYGRVGYPWKVVLNLNLNLKRVRGRLNEQNSHAETAHFFLLFYNDKQQLHIQESKRWPLSRLSALQQMLNH